jgi:hypothetical protein
MAFLSQLAHVVHVVSHLSVPRGTSSAPGRPAPTTALVHAVERCASCACPRASSLGTTQRLSHLFRAGPPPAANAQAELSPAARLTPSTLPDVGSVRRRPSASRARRSGPAQRKLTVPP